MHEGLGPELDGAAQQLVHGELRAVDAGHPAIREFWWPPPARGDVASATRADYAEGAAVVLVGEGREGKVYEFSGDNAWDYKELAATIADVTGTPCSSEADRAGGCRRGHDRGRPGRGHCLLSSPRSRRWWPARGAL